MICSTKLLNIASSILFLLIIFVLSFQKQVQETVRYVALGDSYTICEGATWFESWPYLMTKHLIEAGISIELIANPSKTGWTTQDLIDNELPVFDASAPTFATLLIGVNDWTQGVGQETFRKNLIFIIDHIQNKLPCKKNLLLITIPDFSVTPEGPKYANGRNIAEGLMGFNKIIMEEAKKRNLKCVDIFPFSQKMKDNPLLIAKDNLHPSAKEYANWENLIYPAAYDLLR